MQSEGWPGNDGQGCVKEDVRDGEAECAGDDRERNIFVHVDLILRNQVEDTHDDWK